MPDSTAATTVDLNPGVIWQRVDALLDGFLRLLPNLALAVVVFALFLGLGWGVRNVLRRTTRGHKGQYVGMVLGRLAQALILFIGLMVAVSVVVPSIGGAELLQLLGIGGVAIGFAFRDILQNFVAGLLLLLQQPFRIGDQVVYKEFEGTIEEIETRATLVRTYDGTRVLIPNGELFTNAVRVQTAYPLRRTQATVGIGYGDDPERARRVILDVLGRIDGVVADPAPDVLTTAFNDSTVDLVVRWWSKPQRAAVLDVQSRVLDAVRRAVVEAGIDLAFPTQVVLFHDQTEATDGDRRRQREGWPAGDDPPAPRWRARDAASAARGEDGAGADGQDARGERGGDR